MAHQNIELIAQIKESGINDVLAQKICDILLKDMKRVDAASSKAEVNAKIEETMPKVLSALTTMVTALNTPVRLADVGNRIGLSNRKPAQRSLLMKAFKRLEKDSKVKQVGWLEGKVCSIKEVNNFQRRWIPTGWEPTEV